MTNFLPFERGRLCELSYQLERGMRDAAELSVNTKYEASIIKEAKRLKLKFVFERLATHSYFHFYLKDFVPVILDAIQQQESGAFKQWAYGKLYGYSSESISRFIDGESQ